MTDNLQPLHFEGQPTDTLLLAVTIRDLAIAITELAAAMRLPYESQQTQESEYHCAQCGSPKWNPGGMAESFKVCADCGAIGDQINNET